jgi:hypothetical protein
MKSDTKSEVIGNLAWGGAIIVLALAGSFARTAGYMDDETVKRLVTGTIGLMVAWQGNRMPKSFVPNACARQARRVAGWSMTLSGLIYAGLFLFAPLHVAYLGGAGAILAGIAITLGYCLTLRDRRKTA